MAKSESSRRRGRLRIRRCGEVERVEPTELALHAARDRLDHEQVGGLEREAKGRAAEPHAACVAEAARDEHATRGAEGDA